MTDKVQKIRAFLVGIADTDGVSTILARAIEKKILPYIDSLREESVSEDLQKAAEEYIEFTPRYDIGYELEEGNDPTEIDCFTIDEATAAFIAGAKWQKEKDSIVNDGLEEASKEWLRPQLDKSYANYGETKMMELTHFDGYAMLDAIDFGAKWQKEQLMAKAVGGEWITTTTEC